MQNGLEQMRVLFYLSYFCSILCGVVLFFSGCEVSSDQRESLGLDQNINHLFEKDFESDYIQTDLLELDMMSQSDVDFAKDMLSIGCTQYAPVTQVAQLQTTKITEASGLAQSAFQERILWTHNDSGNEAKLYALQDDGVLLGELQIPVDMNDFEDLDQAPCPHLPRPCLWVGDFGDNQKEREWISIYAIAEPLIQGNFDSLTLDPLEIFALHLLYPDDQSYDAESLVVDHFGRKVWILEKTDEPRSKI